MPQRFASKSKSNLVHSRSSDSSRSLPSMRDANSSSGMRLTFPMLVVAVVALGVLALIVGVNAQLPPIGGTTPSVSHELSNILFDELAVNTQGIPAPITPTIGSGPGAPVATGIQGAWNQAVQWATWGPGSGIAAETAVTATDSSHLETLTLAQVLALAGGNDTVYMKCAIAGGPFQVAAPNQPFDFQSKVSGFSPSNCVGGAAAISCPTIGGITYTDKGWYTEADGTGLTYTLSPNFAQNGSVISYDYTFFANFVGNIVRVCTKSA